MSAIVINKVNTRLDATTSSGKLLPRLPGETINVKRIELGEEYRGSNVWLVDENENRFWSGAFDWNDAGNDLVKSTAFNEFSILEMWKYSQGQEVKIGIIDCGINENHICLEKSRKKIVNVGSNTCMHGTFMSSICLGSDNKNGLIGVAPAAELLFTAFKNVDELKPAELQQCLQSLEDADIISMSFSVFDRRFKTNSNEGKALQDFINKIGERKILVAAAGNLGGIENKYFPAAYDNVISVSAYNKADPSIVHRHANFWSGIHVIGPYESYFDLASDPSHTFPMELSLDGTSSTTAFISSLFALVLSKLKRAKRPVSKKALIESTCVPTTIYSERSKKTYSAFKIDKNKILETLKT